MELIEYRRYTPLKDKSIVVGVTGSVAIYRSIDLVRELIRMGARVKVFMTPSAMELVSPTMFHWATGEEPVVKLTGRVEHIAYSSKYSSMIIAPCTINTLSKIAMGVGDNPVTLTAIAFLGSGKKLIIAPAMNINLYNSPQYKRAVRILNDYGNVYIVEPLIEDGKAKFPPVKDLAHVIEAIISRGMDLKGVRALVTAGPTREYIDPVRVITNPSTGLMGVLVARELAARGAKVTLVHGPISVETPYLVDCIYVETTRDMALRVRELTSINEYDVAVFAAAPADFRPVKTFGEKIPSRVGKLSLELVMTEKVVESIHRRPRIMVCFAAETVSSSKELVDKSKGKLDEYGADLVVGNIVGVGDRGFGSEYIDACLVWRGGHEYLGLLHKAALARIIVDWVANNLGRH